MADQNKLIYISWIIPPAPGGSAYITHQLAKHFHSNEIVVVGGSRKPFQGTKIYDGVNYHYFFTELNWRGHGDRYFSFFRWMLFPFFLLNLIRLTGKEKPEGILATFPDGYYLFASWLISRYFKLNLFSYFHNTYKENRTGISKWIADKIQRWIFSDSKIIFTMSEGMLDYYKSQYPEITHKFEVLPHTFNKYPSINHNGIIRVSTLPYKLVMIGTFNHSNIEATIRLLTLISKYPEKYRVDIYTATNKHLLKYKWGLDLDLLAIKHCGFVKQEEVNQVISNYDACLLTHGFTGEYTQIEYKTIFPTRMIPLLLSEKPILVHSPEDSFLSRFIEKYDCAEIITEKTNVALLSGLVRVTTDKTRITRLKENAAQAVAIFYGPDVVKVLKAKIYSIF